MADLGSLLGSTGIGGAIGKAIVSLELDTTKYQAELKGAEAQTVAGTNTMGQSTSKFGSIAQTAMIGAGAAVVAFGAYSVKAFIESQKVMAQTEAVLESTGGAANVTKDQVLGLADQLRDLSGVDNDVIQSSENLLLTFRDVRNEVGQGNDIFNQTELAILDMATAMNQGALPSQEQLKTSTIQLGKAMNNPIQGMSALRRVGVSFTESQVAVITRMQESGDLMGAQKLILAELTAEFGGAAKAAGGTFAGQMGILQSKFNDVAEALGEALMPAVQGLANSLLLLLPILEKVAQAMEFLPIVQAGENFGSSASGIVKFGDALIDTIPILGSFVNLAGDGVEEATGQGSKGLGNFRGRFFELQQEAAGTADSIDQVRRHIITFADMTGKELKDWRIEVKESFQTAVFALEDLTTQSEVTRHDFIRAQREIVQDARELGRAFREISREHWVNDEYVQFLSAQGPEWIIGFADLNEKQQRRMQEQWEGGSRDFDRTIKQAFENFGIVLEKLDKHDTKHKVTIEYDYVGFDPTKPGMSAGQQGGAVGGQR